MTINVQKEVIKEFKILMVKLELSNQSLLIETLMEKWIKENQC